MAWTKSPPELVERFNDVLGRFPEVQRKQMFGYPAAFIGGNLVTSLFENSWAVRLPPDELDAAQAGGAGTLEVMPGRSMKGYVTLPDADRDHPDRAAAWVIRAVEFGKTLPPKK